jgi:hypothetical protein
MQGFSDTLRSVLLLLTFFPHGSTVVVGLGLLIVEVSRSHSDTPHLVGVLWKGRRDLFLTTHDTHKKRSSMPPAGPEPAVPVSERPQTHTLDRTATVDLPDSYS